MASGDVVGLIQEIMYPGTLAATPDVILGTSTPAESLSVYDFDAATDEFLDFKVRCAGYDAGGFTVSLPWISAQTSNAVGWLVAFRRIADDAEDLDTTAHTYVYNSVSDTSASAIGELSYATITFTDGADSDSVADGDEFILRVSRDADGSVVTDSMTGDASLWSVIITET